MKKLDHQTAESFECPWYSDVRIDFDQNAFCCVNVDLEKTSFVKRRIKECKKTLVSDVWPGIRNVPSSFG